MPDERMKLPGTVPDLGSLGRPPARITHEQPVPTGPPPVFVNGLSAVSVQNDGTVLLAFDHSTGGQVSQPVSLVMPIGAWLEMTRQFETVEQQAVTHAIRATVEAIRRLRPAQPEPEGGTESG